jgi:hypothetical protein
MGVSNFDAIDLPAGGAIRIGGTPVGAGSFVVSHPGVAIGFTSTATAQASNPVFVAPWACRVLAFRVGIDPNANTGGLTAVQLQKNLGGDSTSAVQVLSANVTVASAANGAAGTINAANATLAIGDHLQINSTSAVDQFAVFTIEIQKL